MDRTGLLSSAGRAERGGIPGRRGYDETVSSLSPQQEPESRPYELDPAPELPDGDFQLRGYEPIHPRSRLRELGGKLLAPLAGLGYLLFKSKTALLAIFKFKIFTTSATMLVSIAAYAWIWGWRFAVGFVLLILVHELGHVIELRRQGVPATAPLFIPFLGAVVGMKQLPHDVWREARVALAALDSDRLGARACSGFGLTPFNMLPVSPRDGGRAAAALHPAVWAVGLAILLGLTLLWPNPILILVLVVGGLDVWRRWRERQEPGAAEYYSIAPWQRAVVGVTYVGLTAALALAMSATHVERTF